MLQVKRWLTVGLIVAAAGCGGPAFTVVKQTTPNPLVGMKKYAMLPVTWDGFLFNKQPETVWLQTRSAEQQASWAKDKGDITTKMLERFQVEKKSDEEVAALPAGSAPPSGQYALAINVYAYNDGIFSWRLQVRDAGGQVVDEIEGPPRGGGFGIGMELNTFQIWAPVDTLKYLRTRYEPKN